MNWSYIAAFIDADGSFGINKVKARLSISNTNKEVLEKIQEFIKCGNIYESDRKPGKWKKSYQLSIFNYRDILKILKNIQNELIVKRGRCNKIIKEIEKRLEKRKNWEKKRILAVILNKQGLSDRKAGEELGMSHTFIRKWRLRDKNHISLQSFFKKSLTKTNFFARLSFQDPFFYKDPSTTSLRKKFDI